MKKATSILFIVLYLLSVVKFSIAQNPSLVKDINVTGVIPEFISGSEEISNGILYFKGHDNMGYGLWRSDGTAAGTYSLAAFSLANLGTNLQFLTNVNGTLFFNASNDAEKFGNELWKSNGTSAGTVMVKDIYPGQQGSYLVCLSSIGNTLFFIADDKTHGRELWKSDGTTAGTLLVKDISPGTATTNVDESVVLNGKMFFTPGTTANGFELWITDGTAAGTTLVKDINPLANSSSPNNLTVFNNAVYFEAYDPANGFALWKSDGTAAGTVLVKDFNNSVAYTEFISDMKVSNGKLLIVAKDNDHGAELWISDGTTQGTVLLKDINPGISTSSITLLTDINGTAYFTATDGVHGNEPWRTDGTAAGTIMISDLNPGSNGSNPEGYTLLNGKVIFSASSNGSDRMYATDGTEAGTSVLYTNTASSDLHILIAYNGKIYFKNGDVLMTTDGTATGTIPFVFAITETNYSQYTAYVGIMAKMADDRYIFNANDGINGEEPWVTDGTPAGTFLLKDIGSGTIGSAAKFAAAINDKFFFSAFTENGGNLFVTDGTPNGTTKIAEITPLFPTNAVIGNVIYFPAGNSGNELWRSDGTAAGTFRVKDINPGGDDRVSAYNNFKASATTIFFSADDGIHGEELWKSDGTESGTVLVKDIFPGTNSSSPRNFIEYNGKFYFAAMDANYDVELWVTDGTEQGTYLVKNIALGNKSSGPEDFIVSGGTLFFTAEENIKGRELWKTDGTEAGTVIVKDILPGKKSSGLYDLTDVNGALYFVANDSTHGNELWKSDGTNAGTTIVADLSPGKASSSISWLNNVSGNLYFILEEENGFGNQELWRTDGTACHTQHLDILPGVDDNVSVALADGNKLFFWMHSDIYGTEPWKLLTAPITSYETCNGFDDDCNGLIDDAPTAVITPSGTITICKGNEVTFATDPGINITYQWSKNGNAIAGATQNTFTAGTNASGDFAVVVNGVNGCTSVSDATTLNRLALPAAAITPLGNLDICTAGSVDLKASAGAGYSYQWTKNNQPIPGANNQVYHATSVGDYKVNVTSADGCSKLSKKTTVTTSCKQGDLSLNASMELFPNPASTLLNIRVNEGNGEMLVITNSIGQVVFSQPFMSTEMKIDVASFAPGIYVVQLRTIEGAITRKFVKE